MTAGLIGVHVPVIMALTIIVLMLKKSVCIVWVEKTHDLGRLAHMAGVQEVEGLLDLCDAFTLFAVNGRYPGDLPEISISVARNYFEAAGELRQKLLNHIRDKTTEPQP